jgi:hypothetical protein
MAKTFGLEVNAVSPADIKKHWPLLNGKRCFQATALSGSAAA